MTAHKYHGFGLAICAISALLLFVLPIIMKIYYPSDVPLGFVIVLIAAFSIKKRSYGRYKIFLAEPFETKLALPLLLVPGLLAVIVIMQLIFFSNVTGSEWMLFVIAWILGSHLAFFQTQG